MYQILYITQPQKCKRFRRLAGAFHHISLPHLWPVSKGRYLFQLVPVPKKPLWNNQRTYKMILKFPFSSQGTFEMICTSYDFTSKNLQCISPFLLSDCPAKNRSLHLLTKYVIIHTKQTIICRRTYWIQYGWAASFILIIF